MKLPRLNLSRCQAIFSSLSGDRVISRKDWIRLRIIYCLKYNLIISKKLLQTIKKLRTLRAAQQLLNNLYRCICKDSNKKEINFIIIIDEINPTLISSNKENTSEDSDTVIFEGTVLLLCNML